MKVLILAYASEPGAGSEYGVGWMVPTTMARMYPEHDVYVLTRSRCSAKIEHALTELGLPNLHFLFYDIPKWMTYPNEMKSHWGEQINYLLWQWLVKRYLKKQHKKIHFDIIHHLTFNQYRTPSPGYWMDVPFVVGPIGGAECIAPAFWQDLEPHTRKKEEIRLKGKDLKIFRWFCNRSKNKKIILCSGKENIERLLPYANGNEMKVMAAIGFSQEDFCLPHRDGADNDKNQPFTMIYAGKAWDWKGIKIFLRAVSKGLEASDSFVVKLIGIRFEEEQRRVKGWVSEFGLDEHVQLIPFIERAELLKMEAECDLSVYPAFRDSGSMSILEACALGCPSICFETGGQDVFPDDVLLKVPVKDTYDECMNAFAEKLTWAYNNRKDLRLIGLKAQQWVNENMTWEKKVRQMVELYETRGDETRGGH